MVSTDLEVCAKVAKESRSEYTTPLARAARRIECPRRTAAGAAACRRWPSERHRPIRDSQEKRRATRASAGREAEKDRGHARLLHPRRCTTRECRCSRYHKGWAVYLHVEER